MPPTTHAKMPDDRRSLVHHFVIGGRGPEGLNGYITAGLYQDGTLGEIFLTIHKTGGLARGMSNALAIQISMSLQHGVPLKKIVDKLKGQRFEPQGPTENPAIPWCRSLADYLGRWLELKFAEQIQKETKNVRVQPVETGSSELAPEGDRDNQGISQGPDSGR